MDLVTDPDVTPQQLSDGAQSQDEAIRRFVAGHPRTPRAILRSLFDDPSPLVRAGVAGNPNTPLPARARLAAQDPDDYVRRRAAATLPGAKDGHPVTGW